MGIIPKKASDVLFSNVRKKQSKSNKTELDNFSQDAALFNLFIPKTAFFLLIIVVLLIVFVFGFFLFRNFIMSGLMAFGAHLGIQLFLSMKRKQKEERFSRQLPDTLTAIANSLKAGFSLDQAFEFVTVSMPDPTRSEFSSVHLKYRVGYTLGESLKDLTQKFNNTEVNLFVSSLVLQNQVGGNVIPFLTELSDIIRGRVLLKDQVAVGTTQQRMTSMIISLLPYGLLMLMQLSGYNALTTTFQGILVLILAIIMQGIGLFVINNSMKIDI